MPHGRAPAADAFVVELAVALLALLSLGTVGLALLSRRTAARVSEQAAELAAHDLLTGLALRQAVLDRLDELLPHATRRAPVTVLLVELHRFAAINETYGHEAGDALLVATADRVRDHLEPGDLLARFSGPQLAIVTTVPTGPQEARHRAERLLEALSDPVRVGQDTIRLHAGIGLAVAEAAGDGGEALLADAATALRATGHLDADPIALFGPSMRSELPPLLAEAELRQAIDEDQFWLFYLPVLELGTNRLVGTEALLRWVDPAHGVTEPARFLEALDDSGLIVPVGRWAIRTACEQAVAWRRQHPAAGLTMTVNVSPRQLLDSAFCEDLETILAETGIAPEELCLEIAGGRTVYDAEGVRQTVREAKGLGVQLALDDFGVGLASLDYVRRFNIDVLKIERAFVQRLTDSREDRAIVEQLVGLGQALDITTVAEGVDTEAEADALMAMGCDLAQGYLWMRPQPADALEAAIQRGRILPGGTETSAVDWSGGS